VGGAEDTDSASGAEAADAADVGNPCNTL
jgi:hypothetical protein